MRLWLPEKASARLSIKGLLGAGRISLRDTSALSYRERQGVGDFTFRDRLGNRVPKHDKRRKSPGQARVTRVAIVSALTRSSYFFSEP